MIHSYRKLYKHSDDYINRMFFCNKNKDKSSATYLSSRPSGLLGTEVVTTFLKKAPSLPAVCTLCMSYNSFWCYHKFEKSSWYIYQWRIQTIFKGLQLTQVCTPAQENPKMTKRMASFVINIQPKGIATPHLL